MQAGGSRADRCVPATDDERDARRAALARRRPRASSSGPPVSTIVPPVAAASSRARPSANRSRCHCFDSRPPLTCRPIHGRARAGQSRRAGDPSSSAYAQPGSRRGLRSVAAWRAGRRVAISRARVRRPRARAGRSARGVGQERAAAARRVSDAHRRAGEPREEVRADVGLEVHDQVVRRRAAIARPPRRAWATTSVVPRARATARRRRGRSNAGNHRGEIAVPAADGQVDRRVRPGAGASRDRLERHQQVADALEAQQEHAPDRRRLGVVRATGAARA